MGLTAAMSVGRTALASSQAAIQVIGNNIANAATPGYSRQIVSLAPLPGQSIGNTSLGLGVSISGVRRGTNEALGLDSGSPSCTGLGFSALPGPSVARPCIGTKPDSAQNARKHQSGSILRYRA